MDTIRFVGAIFLFAIVTLAIGRACTGDEQPSQRSSPPDTVVVKVHDEPNPEAVQMMARAIYSESNSMTSFEYIGWVIRNRLQSPNYPSTVAGVILQNYQFSAFNDPGRRQELMSMSYPQTHITEFRRAYRMAEYVLTAPDSMNPLPGVTHFYMEKTLREKYGKDRPAWAKGDPYYSHGQIRFHRNVRPPS